MLRINAQNADFAGISDDEMHYKGEQFVSNLQNLLTEFRPYFGHHEEYRTLDKICNQLQRRLVTEERIVI